MFAVEVRDHVMIAHSFRGAVFGPAQALHGATFVIDVAFIAQTLDGNGIVDRLILAHDLTDGIEAGPIHAPLLVEQSGREHDARPFDDRPLADHRGGGNLFEIPRVEDRPLHPPRFGKGLVASDPVIDFLYVVGLLEHRAA